MKAKSAFLLWLIAPSRSEYLPLVCVCSLPALSHSKAFHYRFTPRTHEHMPFSFSACLFFQCWQVTLFLLLWFRAMLSWRSLCGSTAKGLPALSMSQIKIAHRLPPDTHVLFLGICMFLFADHLPLEHDSSNQGSFALNHPHQLETQSCFTVYLYADGRCGPVWTSVTCVESTVCRLAVLTSCDRHN